MAELTTEVPIPRDVPTTPEEPVISTAPKKDHTRSVALAVGAVIGSAPEIARGVSKSTELLTKIDPRNILALGDHCLPREYNQVLGAFDNDDPNVNVWYPSPELRHRLIADQPEVLTVDGITLPLDYGTYDKKSTWLGLPARPARLNPSKKQIFAIAADKIYADLSTDPTLTHKLVFQEGQDIEQAYTDMDPQARDKRNFIEGTSIGVSAALVVLTTLINKYIDQQTEEGKPATAAASKVSRRAILGSILGASALYGVHRATKVFRSLGVNAALPQEVRAPQEKDAALWQNV
ncbi:MAG TPA: hypothetical protein VE090_02700, partial [Methylomirabilota bacterium]|nr:hypothetical protein [Methylomirabilota bacterium]